MAGCGKSTIGRVPVSLVAFAGSVRLGGCETAGLSAAAMRPLRRSMRMVFQDPFDALNPRVSVGELVAEPPVTYGLVPAAAERTERVADLFRRLGLSPAMMDRRPHESSGGQRQRICIARALALGPRVVIA